MESRSEKKAEDLVEIARQQNYNNIAHLDLGTAYASNGSKNDYRIGYFKNNDSIPNESISTKDIVNAAIRRKNKSSSSVKGIDLGTGIGQVPLHLKEEFKDQLEIQGITTPTVRFRFLGEEKPAHLIFNDIGDLPNIPELKEKKFDFFFSKYTFNYLSDSLKVMSDAYDMLEDDGFLFIDDTYIAGLDYKTANHLFQYLRDQGYDVIAGPGKGANPSSDAPVHYWFFIRKNELSKLIFPVEYKDVITFKTGTGGAGQVTLSLMEYGPNEALTDYISKHPEKKTIDHCEDKELHNQTLANWGVVGASKQDLHKPIAQDNKNSKLQAQFKQFKPSGNKYLDKFLDPNSEYNKKVCKR